MEQALNRLKQRMSDVSDLVSRTNKSSVLVIQQFPVETDHVTLVPMVRESISNILAFVELGSTQVLSIVLEMCDGFFDIIVFDNDLKCKASAELVEYTSKNVTKSKLFFYSDNNTWADSALELIQQLQVNFTDKNLWIAGEGMLYNLVNQKLKNTAATIHSLADPVEDNQRADAIIGASVKNISVPDDCLKLVDKNTMVFDVGIGNFSENFISQCLAIGASVYRVDIRAGISSMVLGILETHYLIHNILGKTVLNGVELVAGGAMGKKGAVIVDDINKPNYIIGIADGKGNVLDPGVENQPQIDFVKRLIGEQ